jgi:hypothetical protein
VVEVFSARPLLSTSATLICTEAWSFEVMRRSGSQVNNCSFIGEKQDGLVAAHLRGT